MKQREVNELQRMVYAGAVLHDGQLLHAYYQLDDRHAVLGDAQLYPQPLVMCEPGAIYSFEVRKGGLAVVRNSALRCGSLADAALVAEWRARDSAVLGSEQAWQRDLPQAFACMAPVREAYRQLAPEGRAILIAQVVRYLCDSQ